MTQYEPNPAVGPTGGEGAEFVDVPPERGATPPAPPPRRADDRSDGDAPDPEQSLPPAPGIP